MNNVSLARVNSIMAIGRVVCVWGGGVWVWVCVCGGVWVWVGVCGGGMGVGVCGGGH